VKPAACKCNLLRWSEEEGWYEEAAYHPGQGGQQEAQMESGVLVQPLNGEEGGGGRKAAMPGSTVPLCKAGVEGPCADDAMNLRGGLCVGLAIAVGACGHPDEGPPREYYREAPVERGVGREAERSVEDGEDGEETVEILCIIFCP
jgi:hypothetical protein